MLRDGCRFSLGVEVVDLVAVTVVDNAAAQLHGRGQSSIRNGEFIRDQQHPLQFLEPRQILINLLDEPYRQAYRCYYLV